MKILLNRYKSVKNTDTNSYVGISLQEEARPLVEEQCIKNIDEYNQYIKEKDACTKYRIDFSISPYCSNILFNRVSEIVYHEGGSDCIEVGSKVNNNINNIATVEKYHRDYLKDSKKGIDRRQMIRDTSYTNAAIGPFVYHCGYDIFNNHFLRQKEFAVVGKLNENSGASEFNTLADYVRDADGNYVSEKKRVFGNPKSKNYTNFTGYTHLYQYDTIKSFQETIRENLIEDENGWWGFLNTSTLPIKNYYEQVLNRTMCNNKSCEQYDMYPDRSLFSFMPKYNKYRDRYENNWNFCLTYPYSAVTNDVVENGLKCYLAEEIAEDSNDIRNDKKVLFRSDIFHNLSRNSQIEINFNGNKIITNVYTIGDSKNEDNGHYFTVPYDDIKKYIGTTDNIRFKKIINGGKCSYYFRVFKKIPVANNNTEEYYSPALNKLGFSQTYYGDSSVNVLFNQDIETSGLTDNLGREVSEIYFTVIKNNNGYEKWYDGSKTDEGIEFSHCFGKITSGMDLPVEALDYNVHKLHNVITGIGCTEEEKEILQISDSAEPLEEGLSIDSENFLGDLVEFSPYTVEETILEYVYHRFNTVQREFTKTAEYHNIYHEEIVTDDEDITPLGLAGFSTDSKKIYNTVDGTTGNTFPANIAPEGYYYNPHYLIRLKRFSNSVQQGSDIKLIFINNEVAFKENIATGILSKNYNISEGDIIYALYDGLQHECKVETLSREGSNRFNTTLKLIAEDDVFPKIIDKVMFFRPNPIKPKGAYELNDGTGRYLWRDMLSNKSITSDDELYNTIFTNGAVYYHRDLNFYLRRQDPFGEYGLSYIGKTGLPSNLDNMNITGSTYDYKAVEYAEENSTQQC